MAVLKQIEIDGKRVNFMASARTPRIYRQRFQRDVILDIKSLRDRYEVVKDSEEQFSALDLTMFENMAYVMAKQADPTIPDTIVDWLDGFNTFDIYEVLPQLMDLWKMNRAGMSQSKKKEDRPNASSTQRSWNCAWGNSALPGSLMSTHTAWSSTCS